MKSSQESVIQKAKDDLKDEISTNIGAVLALKEQLLKDEVVF